VDINLPEFDSDDFESIISQLKNLIESGVEWVNVKSEELSNVQKSEDDLHLPTFLKYTQTFLNMKK